MRYHKLVRRLSELSAQLYSDRFHLLDTLTKAVDDCSYRLGIVDLGTEDFGTRAIDVLDPIPCMFVTITWKTTEYGNLEADFILA